MKPDRMSDFATKRIDDAYCLMHKDFHEIRLLKMPSHSFLIKKKTLFLVLRNLACAHTDSDSKQEPSREIYTETKCDTA